MVDEQGLVPVPPGYYTVEVVDDRKVRIVDGPYEGRIIYLRLPPFKAKVDTVQYD